MDRAALARQHLNIAVDPGNDLEFTLVDFTLIAGDRPIFALGQNYPWERADRFLDDVAAWCKHRPGSVGERLAAPISDQFQRDRGSAMRNRDVGEFFGLHAYIGTDN